MTDDKAAVLYKNRYKHLRGTREPVSLFGVGSSVLGLSIATALPIIGFILGTTGIVCGVIGRVRGANKQYAQPRTGIAAIVVGAVAICLAATIMQIQ